MNSSPLAETFAINNRVNLYLLDAIDEKHLPDNFPGGKGRHVGKQLAHIHDVRMMWLKAAAPELLNGLEKLSDNDALNKKQIATALAKSGKAIETLLDNAATTGKVKGFKPNATAFLGYLLAHEGHHRGQLLIILKQNGHMVDKKTQFGIWEWGVR